MFEKITFAYNMLTDKNFKQRMDDAKKGMSQSDLIAQYRIPVGFEVGFFGRKIKICYSPFVFDKDGKIVNLVEQKKEESSEAICEVKQISVDIYIEAGTCGSCSVELPEKGNRCITGEVGKAIFTIVVQPHEHFKLDQEGNIHSEEQIPLEVMLKGGEVEIVTMYGPRTLNVKPGSMPGDIIELPRCGVRQVHSHFVTITPKHPTKEQLMNDDVWKDLDINWDVKPNTEDQEFQDIYKRIAEGNVWFRN